MTNVSAAPLGDTDRERFTVAAAEIQSDFPNCDVDTDFVVSRARLPAEDVLARGWVFARAE